MKKTKTDLILAHSSRYKGCSNEKVQNVVTTYLLVYLSVPLRKYVIRHLEMRMESVWIRECTCARDIRGSHKERRSIDVELDGVHVEKFDYSGPVRHYPISDS